MVTQKMISFKIDQQLLGHLDIEVFKTGRSRNALINQSVRYFIEYLQYRRAYLEHPDDREVQLKLIRHFEKKQFQNAPYL